MAADNLANTKSSNLERNAALIIRSKDMRFDGSDLMPGEVGAGSFWKGITDYINGTRDLDNAMGAIQAG